MMDAEEVVQVTEIPDEVQRWTPLADARRLVFTAGLVLSCA